MSANKNIPSRKKLVQRRKKVAKELEELLRDLGYGTLFALSASISDKHRTKWATRKTRIVQQEVEFGLPVPQALIDEVNPPEEPNRPPTTWTTANHRSNPRSRRARARPPTIARRLRRDAPSDPGKFAR